MRKFFETFWDIYNTKKDLTIGYQCKCFEGRYDTLQDGKFCVENRPVCAKFRLEFEKTIRFRKLFSRKLSFFS